MNRQRVESSLIKSVGYDVASSVLDVEFVDHDRIYHYYDVPYSVYTDLMAAASKGSYFNEHIRDMYAYQEVDDIEAP